MSPDAPLRLHRLLPFPRNRAWIGLLTRETRFSQTIPCVALRLLVFASLATGWASAQQLGPRHGLPSKDTILDAMRDRSFRLVSARIDWHDECFTARDGLAGGASGEAIMRALNLPNPAPVPPEDVHYERDASFLFDGASTRFHQSGNYPQPEGLVFIDTTESFTGGNRRQYQPPTETHPYPRGRIYKSNSPNYLLTHLNIEPVLHSYRLNHPDFDMLPKLSQFEVGEAAEDVDGASCIALSNRSSRESAGDKMYDTFLLDPARNFVPVRYVQEAGGHVRRQTDFVWRPHTTIQWQLHQWKISQFGSDAKLLSVVDASVKRFDVDPQAPSSEFVVQFPANTIVDDLSGDVPTSYVLRGDGTQRMITRADLGLSYEELMAVDGEGKGPTEANARRPWPIWLVLVNLCVIAGVIVVLLAMRRGRGGNP